MINKQNLGGFTLIELLVVIVIIGILATISVSTFGNYIDKAHQGKSYALEGQINTLIQTDCINQGYSCGVNIVPNWAFSGGDTGEWMLDSLYAIKNYKLFHVGRNSTVPDYNVVPISANMFDEKVYRVDVVTRDVKKNSANMYGAGFIGFSMVGSGIGGHARISSEGGSHICDVFSPTTDNPPIRLFVSAKSEATFDEISIREVHGYGDIGNNNDCGLPSIGFN